MTNQHPITPPPELVREWTSLANEEEGHEVWSSIATQAAHWGADQELEACVEWLGDAPVVWNNNKAMHPGSFLRTARRPNPPTLKEQALALLDKAEDPSWDINDFSIVRKALEAYEI